MPAGITTVPPAVGNEFIAAWIAAVSLVVPLPVAPKFLTSTTVPVVVVGVVVVGVVVVGVVVVGVVVVGVVVVGVVVVGV